MKKLVDVKPWNEIFPEIPCPRTVLITIDLWCIYRRFPLVPDLVKELNIIHRCERTELAISMPRDWQCKACKEEAPDSIKTLWYLYTWDGENDY